MRNRVVSFLRMPALLAALAAGLWFAPSAAQAGGSFVSVHYGYPYYGYGWYHRHYPPYWAYGWPPPVYYGPPAVYYAPPPVYYAPQAEPYCVQDQVYRYLPDGRVQWGTRTRCY